MFDPENDLNAIQKRLLEDDEILDLLGFDSESTEEEKASRIIKRNVWDDLQGNDMRVNIFFKPSRQLNNQIASEEVLQIDVHTPALQDYIAYRVLARAKKLVHKYRVGMRKYYFEGQLGELATMPGFVCAGARFKYYINI